MSVSSTSILIIYGKKIISPWARNVTHRLNETIPMRDLVAIGLGQFIHHTSDDRISFTFSEEVDIQGTEEDYNTIKLLSTGHTSIALAV